MKNSFLSDISIKKFIEKYRNEHFDVIINNAGINEIHGINRITDSVKSNVQ